MAPEYLLKLSLVFFADVVHVPHIAETAPFCTYVTTDVAAFSMHTFVPFSGVLV